MQTNVFSLPISNEAKFLGLTYDQRLTWKADIPGLRKKCLFTLNILKTVNNKYHGPSSRKLLNVYETLVRSKLHYGSTVYSSAPDQFLQTLDPVQKTCLRIVLPTSFTTPTSSLPTITIYTRSNIDVKPSLISMPYTLHLPPHFFTIT